MPEVYYFHSTPYYLDALPEGSAQLHVPIVDNVILVGSNGHHQKAEIEVRKDDETTRITPLYEGGLQVAHVYPSLNRSGAVVVGKTLAFAKPINELVVRRTTGKGSSILWEASAHELRVTDSIACEQFVQTVGTYALKKMQKQ